MAVNREKSSFPVGKVADADDVSMDFEEYLWARGKDLLAEKIREHYIKEQRFRRNCIRRLWENIIIIASLAVCRRQSGRKLQSRPTLSQTEIRQMLLDSYIADMTKYAAPGESVKIFAAYDSLPSQLARGFEEISV